MQKTQEGQRITTGQKAIEFSKKNAIVLVLIALCVGFAIGNQNFLKMTNIVNLTTQMAINAVLTIGLTYVIILGGIDISVGSVAAMAGVAAALVCKSLGDIALPIMIIVQLAVGIVVGAMFGAFNGLMITKFAVVPMIATLASQTIGRGFAYIFTAGYPVTSTDDTFDAIGQGDLWGIPIPVYIMIVCFIVIGILWSRTKFGRHMFAVGGATAVTAKKHLAAI